MMTLILTPEQEHRLKAKAQRAQKPIEAVIDDFLADAPDEPVSALEVVGEAPQTWGAQMLARLEAKGAFGVFQDRPEDSITLARKFQVLAEGHDGEGTEAA